VTLIRCKSLIFISIFLYSCSVETIKKDHKNQILPKNNIGQVESKSIRNDINKEKLNNLFDSNNPTGKVVFEFRKERYLEGIDNKEIDNKINYTQKALQATFKMLTKAPSTGMEHLSIKNNFRKIKFNFSNFYSNKKTNFVNQSPNVVLVLMPLSGKFRGIGEKIRKALDLAMLQVKKDNVKFIYFDTGSDFSISELDSIVEKQNPKLIVGPLLRENLIKIKPSINKFKIPVLSFTNDSSLSKKGIWAIGFSPFEQVEKIVDYAIKCKKKKIGFISIDNNYGRRIYDLIKNSDLTNSLKGEVFINNQIFKNKKQTRISISNFLNHKENENNDFIANQEYDFIILIGNRNFVLRIAPILTYYDVDLFKTDLFGTSVLKEKTLLNEHSLINAKFPWISDLNKNKFEKMWNLVWPNSEPDHLIRLGYYISKISLWAASQNLTFEELIKNGKNKFSILGNKFLFKDNGVVERPSNIFKIDRKGSIKKVNNCL
tara:strand:- start:223 stop:1686 length:1464 start_codon:yes stop_codon:yes gene_type:complete